MARKLEVLPQSWGTRYWFYCPGCKGGHAFQVRDDGGGPSWSFNGDLERPTFSPSLLISGVRPISDEEADILAAGRHVEPVPQVCHLFLEDGKLRFLGDCTHDLKGQTVDLPDAE